MEDSDGSGEGVLSEGVWALDGSSLEVHNQPIFKDSEVVDGCRILANLKRG